MPHPVMRPASAAGTLRVRAQPGGPLVSGGCPGCFGDGGRAGTVQPNLGLDDLFGAREEYVEFTPDILGEIMFEVDGRHLHGGLFLQTYQPTTGTAAGSYSDGTGPYAEGGVAVVDHRYGRGRTRLIGTFPGYGHFHRPSRGSRDFFAGLVDWAGLKPHAHTSTPGVVARLHAGDAATFLWVLNHHRDAASVLVELGGRWGPFRDARLRWGGGHVPVSGRHVRLEIH